MSDQQLPSHSSAPPSEGMTINLPLIRFPLVPLVRFDVMQGDHSVSILDPVPPEHEIWTAEHSRLLAKAHAALAMEDAEVVMGGTSGSGDPTSGTFLRRRPEEYLNEHYPVEDVPPGTPSPTSRGLHVRPSSRPNRGRLLDLSRRRSEGSATVPAPVLVPGAAPASAPASAPIPVPVSVPALVPAVGPARPPMVKCSDPSCGRMFSSKSIADHQKCHKMTAPGGSEKALQPCNFCTDKDCMVSTDPTGQGINTFACVGCLRAHRGCSHKAYGRANPRPRRHPALDPPA